ncbi:hypothetical protein FYJ43_11235 [Cutibacterium sp. WCA-380-WT-3A]|uniref:Uncharacterized protein n=1 Tax=Cutibacterium porci TaxID=2605781 RepID=A0A7K0J9D7_9ACTN|nr:hypothetical protein [Cutibacterium porci]MSS46575.1 hypothetical protein [Cutibacterium porci]
MTVGVTLAAKGCTTEQRDDLPLRSATMYHCAARRCTTAQRDDVPQPPVSVRHITRPHDSHDVTSPW